MKKRLGVAHFFKKIFVFIRCGARLVVAGVVLDWLLQVWCLDWLLQVCQFATSLCPSFFNCFFAKLN